MFGESPACSNAWSIAERPVKPFLIGHDRILDEIAQFELPGGSQRMPLGTTTTCRHEIYGNTARSG